MLNQYIWIVIWLGLMTILASRKALLREELVAGDLVYRYKPLFAFVVVFPIVWMATARGFLGDSWSYIYTYRSMPTSFSRIAQYLSEGGKDLGFRLISVLIRVIFSSDYQIYFFIIAFFQISVVCWFFRKYSENYLFSVFLFIASADYISYVFNGIRQFFAVAITLLATPSILKKKYIRAIILIVIASFFHRSALLMIPFVFIVHGKAWNAKTLVFVFLSILATTFTTQFTELLDSALVGTQYENVVTDYISWGDDGTNPIRVFIYSIPALWAFFQRKRINKCNNPIIAVFVNMSIVSMGIYLVSMVTSGIFIGRLPIYFSLYSYVLLAWEIKNLLNANNRRAVFFLTVFLYLAYYYYIMHFQNALI